MRGEQWIVASGDAGTRLDRFLAAANRLGSRGRAAAAIERGKVFVNEREVGPADAGRRLVPADLVLVWLDRPGSARRVLRPRRFGDLDIVYEDESLLVVDKPPGILAVPLERKRDAVSVLDQLRDHFRSHRVVRPLVVHRIDRDTSGLVLFAKSVRVQQTLKEQFRRREPDRVYWAVVHGVPSPAEGAWRDRIAWDDRALVQKAARGGDPGAREALCRYRVLEAFGRASLLEVRLHTGRRNQIRIQAALHGHPIVGEKRYVAGGASPIPFRRQALHARRLAFQHPVDGRRLEFEARLPPDMNDLVARLRQATPAL